MNLIERRMSAKAVVLPNPKGQGASKIKSRLHSDEWSAMLVSRRLTLHSGEWSPPKGERCAEASFGKFIRHHVKVINDLRTAVVTAVFWKAVVTAKVCESGLSAGWTENNG